MTLREVLRYVAGQLTRAAYQSDVDYGVSRDLGPLRAEPALRNVGGVDDDVQVRRALFRELEDLDIAIRFFRVRAANALPENAPVAVDGVNLLCERHGWIRAACKCEESGRAHESDSRGKLPGFPAAAAVAGPALAPGGSEDADGPGDTD